jgi:hypothetical protein
MEMSKERASALFGGIATKSLKHRLADFAGNEGCISSDIPVNRGVDTSDGGIR